MYMFHVIFEFLDFNWKIITSYYKPYLTHDRLDSTY